MDPFWIQRIAVPNLSIKDVPPAWAEALRRRALRHHRSLQGELMAILEQALTSEMHEAATSARQPAPPSSPDAAGVDGLGRPVLRQGSKTLAQVRQELWERYPQAIAQSSSVALIREERDRR